jgi:integrase
MQKKLGKRDVDSFTFPVGAVSRTGKLIQQAFLWDKGDGAEKGFGVRVTDKGKKTYIAQGRLRGKELRLTIGPTTRRTVDAARKRAKELLTSMEDGIDPRARERAERGVAITLLELANEYVTDPRRQRPLKQSSIDAIMRHVKTTFKGWKDKPITSITKEKCQQRYRQMLDGGLHGKRGAPGQALQCMSVMHTLIEYANEHYQRSDGSALFTSNPARISKKHRPKLKSRNHRRVPTPMIGPVWNMLTAMHGRAYNRADLSSIDLARFLLWTGCRIAEAAELTHDRIDLSAASWFLPDPKNRQPITLPLPKQAVAMLEERPRYANNPFVFAGKDARGHLKDPRSLWDKVKKVAGISKFSAHDTRRTFTYLALTECKIDYFKVELLTGHKLPGVVASNYFDTENLTWLADDVQRVADFIDMKAAQASGANVVELALGKAG